MLTYSDNYNNHIESSSKKSRWAIRISLDDAGTDNLIFTSHADVPVPDGETVVHGVLKDISSRSQTLNPAKFNSSIGSFSFTLVNLNGSVEAELRGKNSAGSVLFDKKCELIRGAEGLDWDDYIVEETQWIGKRFKYKKKKYSINCSDSLSRFESVICRAKETRLSASIDDTTTTVPVYQTTEFNLVQRDADFLDAPNELCTYAKIEDNNKKEFIKISAVNTADFTVTRGVLGTSEQVWTIPQNADEDNGPKVTELVVIDMNMAKAAWAFATGEDLDNPGITIFPEHWHSGIPTDQFVRDEFVALAALTTVKAQTVGLSKVNAKQFFEEDLSFPLGHFLRVNGSGVLNFKKLNAIHEKSSVVGSISASDIIKGGLGDFTHDSSQIVNHLIMNWSWDERTTKPGFRRDNSFEINNSVSTYGKREKSVDLRLINGSSSTTSTLIGIANLHMDRYAGDAALFSINVQHKLSRFEVGDVINIEHPSVADYTASSSLNRSMQIIGKNIDQRRGITLKLFGSTFVADAITDGDTRAMVDSFYTGTNLPNVNSFHLTADTTLAGSGDHNASVWVVDGDLTIDEGVTLTISDNVQLRVKGHITLLGSINGVGNGRVLGSGFIGSTIGYPGNSCQPANVAGGQICSRVLGTAYTGEHEACPSFEIVNEDGTNIEGLPLDLRGSSGGKGGASTTVYANGETIDISPGGSGSSSGSSLVVISRGMSISGAGEINLSGLIGENAVTNGLATGGDGGYSTPGAFVLLLDGGTSSVPVLAGRVIANTHDPASREGKDIGDNIVRIQFIPKARIPVDDEVINDGQIERLYSVNGETNWHFPVEAGDLYFIERVGNGVWSDAFAIKGDDGVDGVSGSSALNLGRRANELSHWYNSINQSSTLPAVTWSVVTDNNAPIWETLIRGEDNADGGNDLFSERLVIDENRKFRVSIHIRQTLGDRKNYLAVTFYDENGDRINNASTPVSDATGWISVGSNHYWGVANDVFPSAWTNYEQEFGGDAAATIPSGAKTMSIGGLFLRDGAVGTNSIIEIQDLHVVELANNGVDGNGFEYVFAKYNSEILPNAKRPDDAWGYDSPSTIDSLTWFDDAPELDSTDVYLYRAQRAIKGSPNQGDSVVANWTIPRIVGRFGNDGTDGYSNILDPEQWVIGDTGTQGDFARNGLNAENSIILDTSPYGESEAVWLCKTNNAGDSNADGGWNNDIDPTKYDTTKTYRYTVWAKQSSVNGSVYLGCRSAFTIAGVANTNPYFFNGDLPELDKWYLIVGILHGSSYSGASSNVSGVYDPETGQKMFNGTDFVCDPAQVSQRHRAFWYYSTDTAAECRFSRPRLDQLNGNEPALLGMFFQAGFRNSGITIGDDGELLGGGGGQVTIGGLGYLGHLSATLGATWGVDLSGRPTELTDGRISAGLDGSGDLVRNLTTARLNSSNVLRYTSGGLFNGHLSATLGATWGADVNSRPVELTDGRISGTIDSAGNLVSGTAVDQGNGVYRNATRGLIAGTARNDDVINFAVAWDQIPSIKFSAGGLAQSNSLSGDQFQDVKAINISTSGFTVQAKLKEIAGSTVSRTDTGVFTAGTQDYEIHKSQSEAFDDSYIFQYGLTIRNNFEPEAGVYFPGTVEVGIYTNDGTGWVKRATVSHNSGFNPTTLNTPQSNQTRAVTVTGLTNHSGREFGISIESDQYGSSTINFDNVSYTTATTPAETSATPTGTPDLEYFVLGGE